MKSEFVWPDDVTKPGGTPAQPCIQSNEPAFEHPSKGYVLGIVGFSPPELVGEVPGLGPQLGWVSSAESDFAPGAPRVAMASSGSISPRQAISWSTERDSDHISGGATSSSSK